jgi:hypothetical protein
MATGGLVILIPHMSDGTKEQQIAGICQEWIDRLDVVGGAFHPEREELGSSDKEIIKKYQRHFSFVVDGRVRQTACVDPELLKCVLNDMIEEAGVNLYLHSWGSRAIVEDECVKGIAFESKSGRQAMLGTFVIDATGDGDVLASAGTGYDGAVDRELRSSMLAVVFRVGDADFARFSEFKVSEPERWNKIMEKLKGIGQFRILPLPTNRDDIVWVNNWVPGRKAVDVEDLTWVEVNVRKAMLPAHEILKKEVPGFEKSFIMDTASQIGTRGSRRLRGEYVVTGQDLRSGKTHDDTIAVFPSISSSDTRGNIYIPYRSLIPEKTEGLLVAGRCF